MLEPLFNKVMKTCSFVKKRLQDRCFPVNTALFTEHHRRLLLSDVLGHEWNLECWTTLSTQIFSLYSVRRRGGGGGFHAPSRKFWISFYGMAFKFSLEVYSRVRNKRLGTLINFGEKFHPRHVHSNHPVYLNLKHFPPTPLLLRMLFSEESLRNKKFPH